MALVERLKYSSATKGLGSLVLVTLQGLCLAEETRNSSEATLVVTTHLVSNTDNMGQSRYVQDSILIVHFSTVTKSVISPDTVISV